MELVHGYEVTAFGNYWSKFVMKNIFTLFQNHLHPPITTP